MKKKILSLLLATALVCALIVPAGACDMGKAGEYNIISAGEAHTATIDSNGSLWMWGNNEWGQLGDGTTESSDVPIKVMDGVLSVSCGKNHTAAIDEKGTLWMWGYNDFGRLGNGTTEASAVPVKIMDKVAAVSCGYWHTAAIKTDGTLWMWGRNESGQLGNGTTAQSLLPVKVMDKVSAVSCGSSHTAAIKTDGTLWTWGANGSYQLGYGTGYNSSITPRQVMEDVVSVSCGDRHTAAIKTDGTLWTWGINNGIGYSDPTKVMEDMATVSCGYNCTAALKDDGSLYMWGANNYGQLGNGSTTDSSVPTLVQYDVNEISCGGSHTIALKWDDTLWTWGSNGNGQLGNGNTANSSTPKKIELKATPIEVPLHLNGGVGTMKLIADEEGKISPPVNPSKTRNSFAGWYSDSALTRLWNFNDKVTKGLQLYARWIPVSSTATTTGKSQSVIYLNGNTITLDAYTLKADNGGDVTYVKLRDIAALLENTSAKFNVDWQRGAIYVSAKTAYTTKNGTELQAISGTDGSYKWNTAPVLFDGTTKALEGIVITDGSGGGHTFFKLRDLGDAIGFTVGWSAEKGIFIETK